MSKINYTIAMIKRELSNTILKTMSQFPVVTLTGPRQSGKTTLLRQLFPEKPYISMEDPDQILRFNDDPKGFLDQYPNGAFFDKFQKVPTLPSYLQRRIDDKKQNGLYILSGSQQLESMASVSQSLAGRTAMLELLPLSLSELNSGGYEVDDNTAIAQGFYPRQYDQQLERI